MVAWRNTSLSLSLTFLGANALAQTPVVPPAPVTPAPVVAPSTLTPGIIPGTEAGAPIVNRPRLEKPSRAGSTELTWLGHSAWVLRAPSGATILIDPWLANPRAPADFVMPETIDGILVTHAHPDHLGQAVELSKQLHAPLIGSYELIEQLGVENGIGTNPGGTVHIKDMAIHVTEAVHSSSLEMPPLPGPVHHEHAANCPCHKNDAIGAEHNHDGADKGKAHNHNDKKRGAKGKNGKNGKADSKVADAKAEPQATPVCICPVHPAEPMPAHPHLINGGAALGFVIEMQQGPTIYHAGDTDVFAGMALIGKRYRPSIGLLPIGGTYTMDGQGAAFAAKLLGVDEVIPMHYGTTSMLPGTPAQLQSALKDDKATQKVRVIAPNPGERVSFMP